MEKERNQYKVMYEIAAEENEMLRARCAFLYQEYEKLAGKNKTAMPKEHSIFYRVARKVYRMITRKG